VGVFANTMWGASSAVSVVTVTASPQRVRGHNWGLGQNNDGVIIACELPFLLIRDLGSTIMRVSLPSNANPNPNPNPNSSHRSVLEAFYSSPTCAPFKKMIKVIVTDLSHLSVLTIKTSTPLQPSVHTNSNLGSNSSYTSNQIQVTNREVFLYSIIDDKFDFFSYSPSALSRAI
jgi:hypothetical protein